MKDRFYYLSLRYLLTHEWFIGHGHNGPRIGRLSNAEAVFTQRAHLEQLHRGNGNKAKRRMGVNPEHNHLAPWLRWVFTTQA